MSLASSEITPSSLKDEGAPDETAALDGLTSPLAEIVAQSPLNSNGRSRPEGKVPPRSGARKGTKARRASSRSKPRAVYPGEVVVGTLAGLNDRGEPMVHHPLDPSGCLLPVRSTLPLDPSQVGREVVLAFEQGDLRRPIILGVLWRSGDKSPETPAPQTTKSPAHLEATIDGEQLVFTADKEIVLQCGKASITLTREGKVQIRGTYLLSRSSGVNRIQGGSIELN